MGYHENQISKVNPVCMFLCWFGIYNYLSLFNFRLYIWKSSQSSTLSSSCTKSSELERTLLTATRNGSQIMILALADVIISTSKFNLLSANLLLVQINNVQFKTIFMWPSYLESISIKQSIEHILQPQKRDNITGFGILALVY